LIQDSEFRDELRFTFSQATLSHYAESENHRETSRLIAPVSQAIP
jgi:hypothetical protein